MKLIFLLSLSVLPGTINSKNSHNKMSNTQTHNYNHNHKHNQQI